MAYGGPDLSQRLREDGRGHGSDDVARLYRLADRRDFVEAQEPGINTLIARTTSDLEHQQAMGFMNPETVRLYQNLRVYEARLALPFYETGIQPTPAQVYSPGAAHTLRNNLEWVAGIVEAGRSATLLSVPNTRRCYRERDATEISAFGHELMGLHLSGYRSVVDNGQVYLLAPDPAHAPIPDAMALEGDNVQMHACLDDIHASMYPDCVDAFQTLVTGIDQAHANAIAQAQETGEFDEAGLRDACATQQAAFHAFLTERTERANVIGGLVGEAQPAAFSVSSPADFEDMMLSTVVSGMRNHFGAPMCARAGDHYQLADVERGLQTAINIRTEMACHQARQAAEAQAHHVPEAAANQDGDAEMEGILEGPALPGHNAHAIHAEHVHAFLGDGAQTLPHVQQGAAVLAEMMAQAQREAAEHGARAAPDADGESGPRPFGYHSS